MGSSLLPFSEHCTCKKQCNCEGKIRAFLTVHSPVLASDLKSLLWHKEERKKWKRERERSVTGHSQSGPSLVRCHGLFCRCEIVLRRHNLPV